MRQANMMYINFFYFNVYENCIFSVLVFVIINVNAAVSRIYNVYNDRIIVCVSFSVSFSVSVSVRVSSNVSVSHRCNINILYVFLTMLRL